MSNNEILTFSNLLTYIGFNIAVFAFLSQYLTFPKDLLSELSRTHRTNSHELPIPANKVTNQSQENFDKASDTIKIFFLEHDIVTLITLLYILFSISNVLLLIAQLKEFVGHYKLVSILLSCVYGCIIISGIILEKRRDMRDWPQGHEIEKLLFYYFLILITAALCIKIGFLSLLDDHERLFLVLICGLLLHFFVYVILLFHNPVTNLLVLWEHLPGPKDGKKQSNFSDQNNDLKITGT